MQVKRDGPEISFAYLDAQEVMEFLGSKAVSHYYTSKGRTEELEDIQKLMQNVSGEGSFILVYHLE